MKITIMDSDTGEQFEVDKKGLDGHWWAEGNGSCDCNRAIYCGKDSGLGSTCLGSLRFIIVASEPCGYTLEELNSSYSPELVARCLEMARAK